MRVLRDVAEVMLGKNYLITDRLQMDVLVERIADKFVREEIWRGASRKPAAPEVF